MNKLQIRFTGVGGQGVILAGGALCEAAVKEGLHAVKMATYTSQVRGGPTLVDVLIDENEIHYPYAIPGETDFMLSTANVSFQRFKDGVRKGGIIVIDPNLVYPNKDDRNRWKIFEIPVVQIADHEVKMIASQSTLALAITVTMIQSVNPEASLRAILAKTKAVYAEGNKKAFALGVKYAMEAMEKTK